MRKSDVENVYLEVLDRQLQEGNPPEVRQAYEQLIAHGHSEEYVRLLIGNWLARSIRTSLAENGLWEVDAYVVALQPLVDEELNVSQARLEMRKTRQRQLQSAINGLRIRRRGAK